jgi:hypothetical protein
VALRDGEVCHHGSVDELRESGELAELIEEVEKDVVEVPDLVLVDDIDKAASHEQDESIGSSATAVEGDLSSTQNNKKKSSTPKILVEKEGKTT